MPASGRHYHAVTVGQMVLPATGRHYRL